jgi:hypothetical protein
MTPPPKFTAETYPPGTAPKQDAYQPAPSNEVPLITNYDDQNVDPDSTTASAADTIGGATSSDVHTGLGHPSSSQTPTEIRHDGAHGLKKQTTGLKGVGAGGADTRLPGDRVAGMDNERGKGIDAGKPGFKSQRASDRDEAAGATGMRGTVGGLTAQERIPESAEAVAAERD